MLLVQKGKNFGKLIRRARPNLIYGIDIWKDDGITSHNDAKLTQEQNDQLYNNLKNLEAKDHHVKIIREYSHIAASSFPDNFFDFVYIDADHTYEAAKDDIKLYWPKVKVNGILSGHDYKKYTDKRCNVTFGVIEAVNEIQKEYNIQHFHTTTEKFPSWLLLKEN